MEYQTALNVYLLLVLCFAWRQEQLALKLLNRVKDNGQLFINGEPAGTVTGVHFEIPRRYGYSPNWPNEEAAEFRSQDHFP